MMHRKRLMMYGPAAVNASPRPNGGPKRSIHLRFFLDNESRVFIIRADQNHTPNPPEHLPLAPHPPSAANQIVADVYRVL